MIQIVTGVFENGIVKPDEEIHLPPGTRVRLIVEPLESIEERDPEDELDRLCREFPVHSQEPHLTRDQLHERR